MILINSYLFASAGPIYIPLFRLNCGGSAQTTSIGAFISDAGYYSTGGGGEYAVGNDISNTTDDIIYQSQRYSSDVTYNFTVSAGNYRIVLHFAELFFSAAGSRIFDVVIKGTKVLDNYDPIGVSGAAFRANIQTFDVAVADTNLAIQISSTLGGGADNAIINAIEIYSIT